MKKVVFFCMAALLLALVSCQDKPNPPLSGYDQEVLKTWSEKIMIPAYKNYQSKAADLVKAAKEFDKNTNENTFSALKENWVTAYKAYQHTMLMDIDVAFSKNYLGMSNAYPTVVEPVQTGDTYNIQSNIEFIANGEVDKVRLTPTAVEARQTYQGFPALDYLLFAEGNDVAYYQSTPAAKTYVVMLAEALKSHIDMVVSYWDSNKDAYINNSDESINGAYVRTINAFVRVYEKNIRSFKVGLAAGAIRAQNGVPEPKVIEAYYNQEISKELLTIALQSSQDFFNGKSFNGTEESKSLKQILIGLGEQQLVDDINNQYDLMYKKINSMSGSLRENAASNTPEMKALYDLIQVNVGNYKTKMLEALNASVNYADTDGD